MRARFDSHSITAGQNGNPAFKTSQVIRDETVYRSDPRLDDCLTVQKDEATIVMLRKHAGQSG